MPAVPQSTRDSITWRLLEHAGAHWPQLDKVQVSYRGSFAYITGVLPGGQQLPLCRLRYGGSFHLAQRCRRGRQRTKPGGAATTPPGRHPAGERGTGVS